MIYVDFEINQGAFYITDVFSHSNYELLLQIAKNYLLILNSFFELPEEIPKYAIHFVLNGFFNEWGELFSTKIATIEKGSNSIVIWSHEKPGIKLSGVNCQFIRGDIRLCAFFDIPLIDIDNSILKNITRHFFSQIMRSIANDALQSEHLRYIKLPTIKYEENIYISYAVTEYFLYHYFTDINFINALSAETYEGSHVHSRLYVAKRGGNRGKRKKAGLKVSFENPIQFGSSNTRQIRKLLEVSDGRLALVVGSVYPKSHLSHLPGRSDGVWLSYSPSENTRYALGFSSEPPKSYENEIVFNGFMSWDYISENYTLKYRKGRYLLSYTRTSTEKKLENKLTDIICEGNPQDISNLTKVILEAQAQKHGTILLISTTENIINETKRLKRLSRAITIKQLNLMDNLEFIPSLASIDGAVFLDFACKCFCIGAILDGDAIIDGNTSRGSRFNSTVNYVMRRSKENQYFYGIIISEDQTTDIISHNGLITKI